MKNFIYVIGLLTVLTSTAWVLGSFKTVEIDTVDIESVESVESAEKAMVGESERMVKLSERIELDTFIDEKYIEDSEFDDDSVIIYTDAIDSKHFKVEEFTKYDRNASNETIRKIKEVHIPELVKVRSSVGKPIIIRSAARSVEHELSMGRSGKSKHVYSNGLGAVDVSLVDYNSKALDTLENAIIDTTNYNRITRYDTFIHIDFAENRFGGRAYYRNAKQGWIYIGKVK